MASFEEREPVQIVFTPKEDSVFYKLSCEQPILRDAISEALDIEMSKPTNGGLPLIK